MLDVGGAVEEMMHQHLQSRSQQKLVVAAMTMSMKIVVLAGGKLNW